jgi:uncharacterized Zn-binding protein involved in type VI secretion
MPAAARINDPDNSDGALISDGASVVKIDGKLAAVVGSLDRSHAPYGPPHPPHQAATVVEGSSVVKIEGKPAARVGDKLSCGHVISSGSSTVNIG